MLVTTAEYHAVIMLAAIIVCAIAAGCGDGQPTYLDTSLPIERRVDDLVGRMTLDEKISQMLNESAPVERLGIPAYDWWNECLHGVARAGRATVFPQAVGLAAMWDDSLMHRTATAISDEARAKHHEFVRCNKRSDYQGLTFWSPNINIFRDPRWGRGMETYGEDPYLTGRMGVAFIKGLQGAHPKYLKVVATAKHFAVHSGPESRRHTFDADISERDLRETYLPHFEKCIREGRAYSVMGAYNRLYGEACCASELLLRDILRGEWGFDGYVVSDCGAIHDFFANHKIVETPAEAAALAVRTGCDLNCGRVYEHLNDAVRQGLLTEKDIDTAVKRLFTARFKLGMFDPPEMVPWANIPYSTVDSAPNRALALETARRSIVLLKNDGGLLPLRKNAGTIAVIGPNADDVEVLLGNYNGTPTDPVTPLRGIREKTAGKSEVIHALGCEWADNLPYFETVPSEAFFTIADGGRRNGLTVEYFDNREFEGAPAKTSIDTTIDVNWWDGAPVEGFDDDNFGVRWTGEIVPPVNGRYALGGIGFSGFRIELDGKPFVRFDSPYHPVTTYEYVELEAGKPYKLLVECYDRKGDAHMRLLWSVPGRDNRREALAAARKADVVIMCMGLTPRLEGEEMKVPVKGFEGGDRIDIGLPAIQNRLIDDVCALGKPVVLVLLNGSALAATRAAERVPAMVEAWYPGQAGGTAIADILFGDANPSGRLPVTFYRSASQLPPFEDYAMQGRTYRYFTGEPLFPFGHGLSYTTFEYRNLGIPARAPSDMTFDVSVDVVNTGARSGIEVVQLYVSDVEASVPVPVRTLRRFRSVALEPGESRTVTFTLKPEDLSLIDDTGKRVVEPGAFDISIGGKQPGFRGLADSPTTAVVTGRITVE